MSRIAAVFQRLHAAGDPGLITYLTAGDPDLARTADLLQVLDRAGADIIELGVPFTDPVADGPVIQRACERALAAGTTLARVLELTAAVRSAVAAPIVIFTYLNPVLRMGAARFAAQAASAGVDGVLLLDAPPEETAQLHELLGAHGIDCILLVSPTTTDARLRAIAARARGFIYAVSRAGVTGGYAHARVADEARALVARIRLVSGLPVAVGFGIGSPAQVRAVNRWADAAVVGSALVERIAAGCDTPAALAHIHAFVSSLKHAQEVVA